MVVAVVTNRGNNLSEAEWEEEREKLLQTVRKANQVAAESQAEAAVCRDLLEDCYKAASEALAQNDMSLLRKIARTSFSYIPTKQDTKEWGKYFLDAYARDAGWLEDAKKALERIKTYAAQLSEATEGNAELKKKIIDVAEEGLITHI